VKESFVDSIREYWPDVPADKLHEDYVGIRPKIQKSDEAFADFCASFPLLYSIAEPATAAIAIPVILAPF